MINLKKILYFNCIVILLAGCGTLSDVGKAVKNQKTNTTDEFLVKKRSPLSMPPDYNEIPKPGTLENTEDNKTDSKKIKEIFNIEREKKLKNSSTKSVEESILNRIGK